MAKKKSAASVIIGIIFFVIGLAICIALGIGLVSTQRKRIGGGGGDPFWNKVADKIEEALNQAIQNDKYKRRFEQWYAGYREYYDDSKFHPLLQRPPRDKAWEAFCKSTFWIYIEEYESPSEYSDVVYNDFEVIDNDINNAKRAIVGTLRNDEFIDDNLKEAERFDGNQSAKQGIKEFCERFDNAINAIRSRTDKPGI